MRVFALLIFFSQEVKFYEEGKSGEEIWSIQPTPQERKTYIFFKDFDISHKTADTLHMRHCHMLHTGCSS